jgi:hypothetical protein
MHVRGLGLTHILGVIQFIENIDHVGRFALPKYDSLTSLPWTIDQLRERDSKRARERAFHTKTKTTLLQELLPRGKGNQTCLERKGIGACGISLEDLERE